jgi:3-dehydroquinate synthetase
MPGRITHDSVQLDAPTSRAVANGIGERLKQSLGSDAPFPDRLQKLLDQMREIEARESAKSKSS